MGGKAEGRTSQKGGGVSFLDDFVDFGESLDDVFSGILDGPSEAFQSLHAEIEADKRRIRNEIDEHSNRLQEEIQRQREETRVFIEETRAHLAQEMRAAEDSRREAGAMMYEMQRHHQNHADAYAFTRETFEEFRGGANLEGSDRVNWKKEGF
jgi:predicted nuclease of restriction endonuclease-like RecB superfamily